MEKLGKEIISVILPDALFLLFYFSFFIGDE